MKKLMTMAASALLLVACGEKPGYTITGTVNNPDMNGKMVYLTPYGIPDATATDSAVINNGQFTLSGTQASAQLYQLKVNTGNESERGYQTVFILENGQLQAALDAKSSSVKGTPENDAYASLYGQLASFDQEMEKLNADSRSEDKAIAETAANKIDELSKQALAKITEYIKANSNKLSAAKLFVENNYEMAEEDLFAIVDKADSLFKSAPRMEKLLPVIEARRNVAVGKKFADFEMTDMNGKTRKLSEFVGNGKIVLIDFWASWCPPCRRDMPNIVEVYKQYKNKGFEIVGVSLDSKKEAWEKGVKDLNITWMQLSDLQGWKNAGAKLYGVNSIPHTVLVDKDGTIIAKGLHGKEIGEKLAEMLK